MIDAAVRMPDTPDIVRVRFRPPASRDGHNVHNLGLRSPSVVMVRPRLVVKVVSVPYRGDTA